MDREDYIRMIDEETQGFCVYPPGYNENCQDCTLCRKTFLDDVRHILDCGGHLRLLCIDRGTVQIRGDETC